FADTFQFTIDGRLSGKLNGGQGINTIVGPDRGNIWNINFQNGGKLNGMSFANIENLTGGSGDDDFVLAAGMGIAGKIDGGGGLHNTLDYSHYTTAVNVTLATGAATNVFARAAGGVQNFEIVLGGNGNDTLTGGAIGVVLVGNGGNDKLTGGSGRN